MKTIVFFAPAVYIRTYKIVLGLKKTGKYKLILITRWNKYNPFFDFRDVFDKTISYGIIPIKILDDFVHRFFKKYIEILELWKLTHIIKKMNPYIFHCHTVLTTGAEIVIKNAKAPIIIEYETAPIGIIKGIENLSEKDRIAERYCLEHTNGIIYRASIDEIEYFKKRGYKINCPTLLFSHYCSKQLFAEQDIKKLSDKDHEIHLVYTGCMSAKQTNCDYDYYIPLAKKLSSMKIHFNMYPPPFSCDMTRDEKKFFKKHYEYIQLDKTNPYFHFHKPAKYEKLSQEIAKYDFGVMDQIGLEYKLRDFNESLLQKCWIGNKLFSYLEAGIPIIVSEKAIGDKTIIENYKVGFTIKVGEINHIKEIIKKYDYEKLKGNVLKAREELSIDNQIERLEDFYRRIAEIK